METDSKRDGGIVNMAQQREVFMEISPADFFYRNRDLAGFTNPSRAVYATIRELLENSLDACELHRIPPEIYIRLSQESSNDKAETYRIRIMDNGSGVPPEHIPSAFGQILYGSKYTLKQVRGTFGLGGKMAVLYGQITTHSSVHIISSTGTSRIYEFELMIDIQKNRPIIMKKDVKSNKDKWHGTIIEFTFEGDYTKAMAKIIEYMKQTAMVAPYANLTFIDPKGRLYRYTRITDKLPPPPDEILPHPYGVDVETIQRIINVTKCRDMLCFMTTHFHRVGKNTAEKFLEYAQLDGKTDPKRLTPDDSVALAQAMRNFPDFLPPDASCLSPIGRELLEAGIRKELNPDFIIVEQRKPAAYSGYPFIVEVGVAFGGEVPSKTGIALYRFANRIPLLYDESSDVAWKVANTKVNWRHYKVTPDMPIALIVHICSTKVPYKTVGKEFIADRPEVENEILRGVRNVSRRLRLFLSRKISIERERQRLNVFSRYLPKIAKFATELAEKEEEPDIKPLLGSIDRFRSFSENEEE